MLEILRNFLEAILQALLAVVMGVFGFSWDTPEENTKEAEVVTEIVRLQSQPLYSLKIQLVSTLQSTKAKG